MGSRNTNTRLNTFADKVIYNLKNLRDDSCRFFSQVLFLKDGDSWKLPGNYQMRRGFCGIDILKDDEYVDTFSNKKIATSWCILNANNKKDQSRLLRYHDNRKYFLENNIIINKKQLKSADNHEDRDIIQARISDDYQKLNVSKKQIDKMINLAKYFQIRGFEHEAF